MQAFKTTPGCEGHEQIEEASSEQLLLQDPSGHKLNPFGHELGPNWVGHDFWSVTHKTGQSTFGLVTAGHVVPLLKFPLTKCINE